MTRSTWIGAVSALLLLDTPVGAQSPTGPGLLTRYSFHLSAQKIDGDQSGLPGRELTWDADFGGDVDLVDYGAGRINFLANYEALIGHERQLFDPVWANYTLDLLASWRIKGNEIAAVLHHVSRHLSDREKDFPVNWNMVGVRAMRGFEYGTARLDLRADLAGVTERAFVDYRWQFDTAITATRPLNRFAAVRGTAGLTLIGVDPAIKGRDRRVGSRFEGGVRVPGRGAAVDLFLAIERRIDADFTNPTTWVLAGFRLVNR
jgi:hypothetical protein